jgi:predicted nucleic acid-binding protein
MAYLLDTGILLRLANPADNLHSQVRIAVGALGNQGEQLITTTQNIAEFCNVATRPVANNGLGHTPAAALEFVATDIETICAVVAEIDATYIRLKCLIAKYSVVGKQVHDARLVAMMLEWHIENVLTLNDRDFRRYEPEGIKIATPDTVAAHDP